MTGTKKLLRPDKSTSWLTDLLFMIVPVLLLAPGIYYSSIAPPPDYKYGGPGFVDGSLGWIGDVAGYIMLLFLVSLFTIALFRLVYRFQHRKEP
ncbi:MAG TPA: hypothetical protein VK983_01555 [Candidatus Limnocylindrales bacterium]|nr:hypothetical protein [Candidatus Limnocylindrales bacterium]